VLIVLTGSDNTGGVLEETEEADVTKWCTVIFLVPSEAASGTRKTGKPHVGPDTLLTATTFTCFSFPRTSSFSDVHPIDIAVRNLKVEMDIATPFADVSKVKFTRLKVSDAEDGEEGGARRKQILKDVSADTRGSWSGEVSIRHAQDIRSHA